jgi:hypothetical protein
LANLIPPQLPLPLDTAHNFTAEKVAKEIADMHNHAFPENRTREQALRMHDVGMPAMFHNPSA